MTKFISKSSLILRNAEKLSTSGDLKTSLSRYKEAYNELKRELLNLNKFEESYDKDMTSIVEKMSQVKIKINVLEEAINEKNEM